MGVSINLHVYDKDRLVTEIDEYVKKEGGYREGAHRADSFLTLVADSFGLLTPTQFLVVWNEYYEDYNPASNFLNAVDKYYFPERNEDNALDGGWWESFWADSYSTCSGGANADEVLGDLFPEEFGYEGKFADVE